MTESVNFVFSQLMSRACGGVDYKGDEALQAGASYPEKQGCETRVEFIDDIDGLGAEMLEPQRIAAMIRAMMAEGFTVTENGAERPVAYRDFCVLLRSSNQYAPRYAENLRALGIPAWAASTGGFFSASEIATILSFLRVIDNPNQDIPLLAVLMSPVYGFTADDMARLRADCGGGNAVRLAAPRRGRALHARAGGDRALPHSGFHDALGRVHHDALRRDGL